MSGNDTLLSLTGKRKVSSEAISNQSDLSPLLAAHFNVTWHEQREAQGKSDHVYLEHQMCICHTTCSKSPCLPQQHIHGSSETQLESFPRMTEIYAESRTQMTIGTKIATQNNLCSNTLMRTVREITNRNRYNYAKSRGGGVLAYTYICYFE